MQDVFAKIWEGRNEIDPEDSLKTYVFKIAQNLSINKLRRKKVESRYTEIYKLAYFEQHDVDDVYTLIVKDLLEAVSLLPATYSGSDVGRITKGAAQTLLGQVYLTQKKYSDAVTQFSAVISDGNYSLLTNYEDNFAAGLQGNSEAI